MQFCSWFTVSQLKLFVFIHVLHYVFISEQCNKCNQYAQLSGIITDDVIIKTCCAMTEINYVRLSDCQASHLIQPCCKRCIVIDIVNWDIVVVVFYIYVVFLWNSRYNSDVNVVDLVCHFSAVVVVDFRFRMQTHRVCPNPGFRICWLPTLGSYMAPIFTSTIVWMIKAGHVSERCYFVVIWQVSRSSLVTQQCQNIVLKHWQ